MSNGLGKSQEGRLDNKNKNNCVVIVGVIEVAVVGVGTIKGGSLGSKKKDQYLIPSDRFCIGKFSRFQDPIFLVQDNRNVYSNTIGKY